MSPEALLTGCACASVGIAAGTAAAMPPAASMPCRKPRRSFVLESIVILALVYASTVILGAPRAAAANLLQNFLGHGRGICVDRDGVLHALRIPARQYDRHRNPLRQGRPQYQAV